MMLENLKKESPIHAFDDFNIVRVLQQRKTVNIHIAC